MKIGIIGSGGREHALCEALIKSNKVNKIYCFPGNGGTSKIAENIDLNLKDYNNLKDFILEKKLDLTIVGPENHLVDGIVDFLENYNIKVFGPNKYAAQLEGSKIFTKNLCKKLNIPTANFGVYEDIESSSEFLKNCAFPIVIKADCLAAGKGVFICENLHQAQKAVNQIFDGKFGKTNQVLIEEFLNGEEMSFFVISDGKNYKKFGTAQDHKRVFEGDKGLNTGGMGAYSPSRLENKILDKKIFTKIIEPTLNYLKTNCKNFKGFLYAGLMIINNEPFLIEYNVRMGDPECQTILPRLKTDFFQIINSAVNENLDTQEIEWHDEKTLCIVLCSKGYPEKYLSNIEIPNLENLNLEKNSYIFHAGTKKQNQTTLSNGGRVLNFVSKADNFKTARKNSIHLIKKLNWSNGFFRNDIGFKVIE